MSSPRRTVLFLHSSAGRYGADRQLGVLAGGLDPERWRPLVVLPHSGPLVEDLLERGVEVKIGPLAVLRREHLGLRGPPWLARELGRQLRALATLIAEERVALVHANTSVILGARSAATHAGIPLVTHVREIYPRPPVAWPAYRASLQRADRLACVSAATAAQFEGGHVRVIHDGLEEAPARAGRTAARTTLGLPEEAFVVALLGRLSEWKGQRLLIEALQRTEGIALLAGDPWPGNENVLDELKAAAAPLGDRVRFLGFRDDLETVLGAADVVAVPSLEPDPFPNAALESAAAGCCVVAAGHGGLPEIIRDGETGVLFPPGDAAALAAALQGLDRPRIEALGARAAADVAARFGARRMLGELEALYEELL